MFHTPSFFSSFKRARAVKRLQRIIFPPGFDSITDFRDEFKPDRQQNLNRAWDEYLKLCKSDDTVQRLIQKHKLTDDDLRKLTRKYGFSGLGGWINGHEIGLSTIAYAEPLEYALEAEERAGISHAEVAWQLSEYWKGHIPRGGLLSQLADT